MEKIYQLAIVGGGASGLFLASAKPAQNIILFEKGERVGRKLSATGNGQGNLTNVRASQTPYFSSSNPALAQAIVRSHDEKELQEFMQKLGLLLVSDDKGRVYPAGRQASAITDALRFYIQKLGVQTKLSCAVLGLEKQNGLFKITAQDGTYYAENVALCSGGKASKNFGTDGTAYALAQNFLHGLTKLCPSLVQLKTETNFIKTLKGIRVSPARVTATYKGGTHTEEGDILFTDYGVSGDAIFRLSAFCTDKIDDGVSLKIDFLPQFTHGEIALAIEQKRKNLPDIEPSELLCGMVNNQIARAVAKRAENKVGTYASLLKNFTLRVTGTLGFDYAQVTKGGIPLNETDGDLQSKLQPNLYFAGEILDVDGACGGFNLQWAYSSAQTVAQAIKKRYQK